MFLETAIGKLVASVAIIGIVAGVCFWRGHSAGWNGAINRDKAVVASCLQANGTLEAAVEQLKQANGAYADAAKVSDAKASKAHEEMQAQAQASAHALQAAKAKLNEVIHATPANVAAADQRVPVAVADRLRE